MLHILRVHLRIAVLILILSIFTSIKAYSNTIYKADAAKTIKIITLSPHLTQLMLDLNLQTILIGGSYIDETLNYLPKIADAKSLWLNRIVQLKQQHPNAVIIALAWQGGNSQLFEKQLKTFGIETHWFATQYAEDLINSALKIQQLIYPFLDKNQQINLQIKINKLLQLRQSLIELKSNYAKFTSLASVYPIWWQPLMIINGKHYINDVLNICNTPNVFTNSLGTNISQEALLKANFNRLLLSDLTKKNMPDVFKVIFSQKKYVLKIIPEGILSTPSIKHLEKTEQLCQLIRS